MSDESNEISPALASAIENIPDRANGRESLRHIGRYCTTEFMLQVDDVPFHISVKSGEVQRVRRGPFNMLSWQFAIRGSQSAWREFWSSAPAPGYNDIFALSAYGHARIDGDIAPLLKDLRFIKEVIAIPREELS